MSKKRERIFNGEEPAHPLLAATEEDIANNPLHAFDALRYCLYYPLESPKTDEGEHWRYIKIPKALEEYFIDAINKLMSIKKPGKDCPELVAEAFGLTAAHFSSLGKDQWEGQMYYEVQKARKQGLTLVEALESVAKNNNIDPESFINKYHNDIKKSCSSK
ncbi:MAG: hypothetical protein AB7D51_10835 [Desulfovibrionaceae bacterium]